MEKKIKKLELDILKLEIKKSDIQVNIDKLSKEKQDLENLAIANLVRMKKMTYGQFKDFLQNEKMEENT
ncbi:MAG: DUF4315 family protein [Clostridia bacterium]